MTVKSVIEAVREAIFEEMARDAKVFVMGEDVGIRGIDDLFGVFFGLGLYGVPILARPIQPAAPPEIFLKRQEKGEIFDPVALSFTKLTDGTVIQQRILL